MCKTTNVVSGTATSPSALSSSSSSPPRVAVIGGGVSGLAAAWHLHVNTDHEVELFERRETLGGHSYTVHVTQDKTPVDLGFMVFNHPNYPNLVRWFQTLGVQEEDSDMSLSVSLNGGQSLEWSSNGLNGLLAKRSQAVSPSFYQFLWDMARFHKEGAELLLLHNEDPRKHVTTGQYLRDHNYCEAFGTYYLLPMMAALWSASLEDVLNFPAAQLVGFLCNHKMLQLFDRPHWKTVAGRSVQYTTKVQQLLGKRARTLSPVLYMKQEQDEDGSKSYTLYGPNHEEYGTYEHVIFACHPPTTQAILTTSLEFLHSSDANTVEQLQNLLGQIEYADNDIYVHSDPKLMPARQRAWASWNCLGKLEELQALHGSNQTNKKKDEAFEGGASGFGNTTEKEGDGSSRMKAVYVTYWLNRLQNLKCQEDIFVSLNPHQAPDSDKIHHRVNLAHPQFNPGTLRARKTILEEYQGVNNLWFAGAWAGYGFHEDGCRSGMQAATALSGVPLPWVSTELAAENQLVLAPPNLAQEHLSNWWYGGGIVSRLYKQLTYDLPIAVCRPMILHFLGKAVKQGQLQLWFNDGSVQSFGDGTPCGADPHPVTLRIFDNWFFVKTALEYDLGLARSYMAGHFVVEALEKHQAYDSVLKPPTSPDETTLAIGDPIGLTRLFLLLIGNRDATHTPRKAGCGTSYANEMTNASGLLISKLGSLLNFLRYKWTMDNSERGGSLKNIHSHYDLSNDLFKIFLDKDTLMYSCAIFEAVQAPKPQTGLVFRGTLEEAQWRKLDTYLARAQVQPGQTLLDIGFGWGGLTLRAATKYGCHVTGITLSVEQKALAQQRVKEAGVEHLVTFEVVDYRTFCRRPENRGKFDRVVSCEMIEAVGHEHLGEFFWGVEQVLNAKGILVMGAITTPEQRYETYIRSTDFINTIIFPGSCCPSLHALVDAAYQNSCLTLEHIDNIGMHYAQTLAHWRRRFNAGEVQVHALGFDDVFLRAWNYYLTYCEAGFFSQTENILILVFARPGCHSLAPMCETRSVTQAAPLSDAEIQSFLAANTETLPNQRRDGVA